MQMTEERVSKLDNRSTEIIQTEEGKEDWKTVNRAPTTCGSIFKGLT